MRLSSVSLVAVLLFATSSISAQHSSGGGNSSGSSSSGGGLHSSSSGGSSSSSGSSGSSSHSSGSSSGGSSYSGGSHSSGGSHGSGTSHSASGGGHSSPGAHTSGTSSVYRGSGSHGKNERGSNLTTTTRNGSAGKSDLSRPIHESKGGMTERTLQPEKRGFFSRVFHPFWKPQPKLEPKPALYLPRPICPHGRCALPCPVGQVRNGGACSTPVIQACASGHIWNSNACGYNEHYNCPIGETWTALPALTSPTFSTIASTRGRNYNARCNACRRQIPCGRASVPTA